MDPERPIEKLLRETARTREGQAGAPPPLHPADRRALQAEVQRQYRSKQPASGSRFFAILLAPKVVWASAIILLLAAGFWIINPPRKDLGHLALKREALDAVKEDYAQKTPMRGYAESPPKSVPATPASSAAREQQPTVAPPKELALNEPVPMAETATGDKLAEVPPVEARPAASGSIGGGGANVGFPVASASPPATAAPAEAPSGRGGASSMGFAGKPQALADAASRLEQGQAGQEGQKGEREAGFAVQADSIQRNSQVNQAPSSNVRYGYFARQSNFASAEAGRPQRSLGSFKRSVPVEEKVLTRFNIEQNGSEIVVNDNDGSVYSGNVEPMTSNSQTPETNQATIKALSADRAKQALQAESQQALLFAVRGTNRTLNRVVTFNGQLLTNLLQMNLNQQQNRANNRVRSQVENQPVPSVVGEVRVEGAPAFQMEAGEAGQ